MVEGKNMNSKTKDTGSCSVHFLEEVRNELSEKVAMLDEEEFVEGDSQDVLNGKSNSTDVANRDPTTPLREIGVAMHDFHVNPKANESCKVIQQQLGTEMQHIHADQKAKASL